MKVANIPKDYYTQEVFKRGHRHRRDFIGMRVADLPPMVGQGGQSHPAIGGGAFIMNNWFVYILRSLKDGRYYIGSASDLEKRIERHNRGGNISTKNRRPLELVYFEIYNTRVEALCREKTIKSYKGGEAFKKLICQI